MKKEKREKIKKILILAIIVIILVFITIKLFPMFKDISTTEGRIQIKEQIQGIGIKGIFVIIGLMFAQIFLPILPGEPVEILAGMCFGPVGGLLIIMLGTLISTFTILILVKKFGRAFLYTFVAKEKLDKLENHPIFANKKRIYIVLFILFFIPGTPKDIFVYIGALLPISAVKFVIISTIARFPSIISSTIAGNNIMNENWGAIVAVYAVTFALSGVLIYFASKNDKNFKDIIGGKNGTV